MSAIGNGPGREPGEVEREQLERYLAGELPASEAEAFEARVLADPALAHALYREQGLTLAVAATRPEADAAPRAARRFPAWWMRGGAPLAAAAAVVVVAGVTFLLVRGPGSERMRNGEVVGRLIAPVGAVPAPPEEFRWSRHPGAEQYRFELHDGAGRVVHVALTRDTVYRVVPSNGTRVPPEGTWRAIPLTSGGHELPGPPAATYRPR
jgi:hypothetical protein